MNDLLAPRPHLPISNAEVAGARSNLSRPTRSPATEASYRRRTRQLIEAANAKAGCVLTPVGFAEQLLRERDNYAPSSWRQLRASVVFVFTEAAAQQPKRARQLFAAITVLQVPKDAATTGAGVLRTSQYKAKALDDDDLDRIRHAASADACPHANALDRSLLASAAVGARISEWPTALLRKSQIDGFEWEVILICGKNSNGRANGETRVLRWHSLPDDVLAAIEGWIAIASEAAAHGRYEQLVDTLSSLMRRLTRRLFPRRRRRPTLASTRHAAVARWKRHYYAGAVTAEEKAEARAIVAALLGHASDATANSHYARAARSSSRKFPIPVPDPAEVARVRRRFREPDFAGRRRPSPPAPGKP